jgi:hypothetical protein
VTKRLRIEGWRGTRLSKGPGLAPGADRRSGIQPQIGNLSAAW